MRDIDSTIMAQLESGELRPFKLIHLDIGAGFYYTDCDAPITYGGNRYVNRGFELSAINYSIGTIVDSCDISIDDLDEDLKPEFIGGSPQDSNVIIMEVLLDPDYKIYGDTHATWFNGEIGEWEYDEGLLSMNLTNMFARWNNKTTAKHSASCRWRKFKGTECGYAGSETECDRSYTRCVALGNQDNFGGFRWLPSIEGVDIWWGRESKADL